jgi:hypothetical protein
VSIGEDTHLLTEKVTRRWEVLGGWRMRGGNYFLLFLILPFLIVSRGL